MADITKNDDDRASELEATFIFPDPTTFLKGNNFQDGDWALKTATPIHIGLRTESEVKRYESELKNDSEIPDEKVAEMVHAFRSLVVDSADYDTINQHPTPGNVLRQVQIVYEAGFDHFRNSRQEKILQNFLDGSLEVVSFGSFEAPNNLARAGINKLPVWQFINGAKDDQGEAVKVKTPRLRSYGDLVRMQGVMTKLKEEFSVYNAGIYRRLITKNTLVAAYESDGETRVCVPADLRVDKFTYRGETKYCVSVEVELNPNGNAADISRGMTAIKKTLRSLGGLETTLSFGEYSLLRGSAAQEYMHKNLNVGDRTVSDAEFGALYKSMSQAVPAVFAELDKNPTKVYDTIPVAERNLMRVLQDSSRFTEHCVPTNF